PSDTGYRAIAFWLMLPVMWLARLSFILAARNYFLHDGGSIDLLHVHESGWLAGLGVWLGRYRGFQVIAKEPLFPSLMPIGYDVPFRRIWTHLRRQARFVAMDGYISADLQRHGIPDEQIIILPNGVRVPNEYADVAVHRSVLYLGNFSQGMMHKAFDILVDAWALIHCKVKDARITLAGSGEAVRWKKQAQAAGCLESMTFTGWVPDTDSLFRVSGIFVLPSRMEGLSNALLEAQSWGLACVVSDIPGNLALVENNVNGLVVPTGDARALAAAILKLIVDPELRVRLGREARKKMIACYEIGLVARRFVQTYKQLIQINSERTGFSCP
ncbi:MAG: glycosyltransferase family 4 protein, partial [Kiritimatiellae bacterium]|nr:glycosyltransferase family 4 protein [Kiritimatiellia bacterium]